jgi:hypothetical protein
MAGLDGFRIVTPFTRTLLLGGLFISGTLLGIVLSPTVFASLTGLVQEMQATPPASGKKSRAVLANALDIAVSPYSEQKTTGPVILASVRESELGDALASMGLSPERERIIADEVKSHRYRLFWLTVWDWDGDVVPKRINIASGVYKRQMELPKGRKTVAIPEPLSRFIEISGDPHNRGYEGWTTLALLSGERPIAMSRLVPGKSLQIEIDIADHP